ncbi:MAG: adenylate/guanylate cyclase domain-containing protein [Arenicellales bacterium]|nr:adenylate/guanylate cyclase domain-containing protein [Arenicellales bacterium]
MAESQPSSKFAFILHADVVGSTALVQQDERIAHQRIQTAFRRFAETIVAHGGIAHELRGDAVVAEFEKASDAVSAALSFQKDNARSNAESSEPIRPELRIGIGMGEVVIGDNTVTGAGVVLAQRLEQLSKPGGVVIQGAVQEAIPRRLPFEYTSLGEKEVKGFDTPVRAYTVDIAAGKPIPEPEARPKVAETKPRSKHGLKLIVSVGLLIAVVGALVVWLKPWQVEQKTSLVESQVLERTKLPSLAVLPFNNFSGDQTQEYFADGITEDLTTDLSKLSGLFVISRNSAFTFKGKTSRSKDVADQLGVRYLLEGSVRRDADRIRINAQLIDTATGGHIWADRYDGTLTDVFDFQDQVVRQIVEALSLKMLPEDSKRLVGSGTTSVEAHDAYLSGLAAYYRRSPEANAEARSHFERALQFDPDFFDAYTALAKVYIRAAILEQDYADKLGIYWADGYTRARSFLANVQAEPNADYYVLRSWLNLNKHQHSNAISDARQALSLRPNDADALEALAAALIFSGDYEQGIVSAEQAIRQNPTLMGYPLYLIGVAEFARNNIEESIRRIEQAKQNTLSKRADFSGMLASALGQRGDLEPARIAFDEYAREYVNRPARAWSAKTQSFVNPRFHAWRRIDLAWSVYAFPFSDNDVLDRFATGLELAGATVGLGRYLPLSSSNRLNGPEVKTLLYDQTIEGQDFWLSQFDWQQTRSATGFVEHTGFDIHPGLPADATGQGEIKDDTLCETWPVISRIANLCVTVFRVPDADARARWGEYVMVTDTGPHPFTVSR